MPLSINPLFFLFLVLMLLTLPLRWLLACFLAAGLHELCHVLAVILLGGQLHRFHIQIGGAVIEATLPGRFSEMFSILAGPVGSLCLFFLLHIWPELAVCGAIQGIFNLLPLPQLDGGRLLHMFLHKI